MGRLRRSITDANLRRPINRISRPLSRVRTMVFSEPSIPEEEDGEERPPLTTDSPAMPRRRSLTWQGYYMSKKAKAQQMLEPPPDSPGLGCEEIKGLF